MIITLLLAGCQVDITPPSATSELVNKPESVRATAVTLAWDANTELDLAGYIVHYGPATRAYNQHRDIGNVTTFIVDDAPAGINYFAVTAYNEDMFESAFSNEITFGEMVTPTPNPIPGHIVNISTRAFVQGGDNILVAGFIIKDHPSRVLIRAIGPSLSPFFPLTLTNPLLELRNSASVLIDENDDWRSDQEAEIIATGVAPTNDFESAIVRTLEPGQYTAIVRGVNGLTGVALVEIYALDDP